MASQHIVDVTDNSFTAEVEQAAGLTLVDFWATWCAPCQAIAPVMEQVASEYEGKVKVAKLDTDLNQQTAMRFNVRSIPTILFFRNGKVVDTILGADPRIRTMLDTKIQQHLS